MGTRRLFITMFIASVFGVLTASVAIAATGSIDDETFDFKGVVQQLPASGGLVGDWRVGGLIVHVSLATEIEQEDRPISVGALVEAKGDLLADGSVNARKIESTEIEDENEIDFKGTIQSFPSGFVGDWNVGGRVVHVTAATRIKQEDGPVAMGAFAEVEGAVRSDGSIDATTIEIKSDVGGDDGRHELHGSIQSLPSAAGFIGDWVVSGHTVRVTASTVIDQEKGPIALGVTVEVKGVLLPGGMLEASKIEVKSDGQTESHSSKIRGVVQSLPASGLLGDWLVSGEIVHVTSSTRISQEHGQIVIGTRVKIKGVRQPDGSLVAGKVQVKDSN